MKMLGKKTLITMVNAESTLTFTFFNTNNLQMLQILCGTIYTCIVVSPSKFVLTEIHLQFAS